MNTETSPPLACPLVAAATSGRRDHVEQVARAQTHLHAFIAFLERVPFQEKTFALSMDLYALFKEFCGEDLPPGFALEFGRQVNRACRCGRLPFKRSLRTRASLAAFDGIDSNLLREALRAAKRPLA